MINHDDTRSDINKSLVVYINSQSIGRGDLELGNTLMGAFLDTLNQSINEISHIILINSGVKLACKGSPFIDDLNAFEEIGANILSCGTCLKYFGIMEELAAGEVSNMVEIVDTLKKAGRIISP